jgi:chromosome segregation ATPase
MGDLLETSPQNEEMARELTRVRQLIEKRILPALRESGSDDKLPPAEALTAYLNLTARKEREGKLFAERLEGELVKVRGGREEGERKEQQLQREATKLANDNSLLKENLRDIYESLLSIAFPDQNDSEKTFEQILDHLTDTLQNHNALQAHLHTANRDAHALKQEVLSLKTELHSLKQEGHQQSALRGEVDRLKQ